MPICIDSSVFVRGLHEPIPVHIVQAYIMRGLPEKADAFIGAFAEWQQVSHLISLNRHFLRGLDSIPFTVLDPSAYLQQLAG